VRRPGLAGPDDYIGGKTGFFAGRKMVTESIFQPIMHLELTSSPFSARLPASRHIR
jgi:hypothetical protein